MNSSRSAGAAFRLGLSGLCAGALLLALLPRAAFAQGRLDALYDATLAGIPVGKGTWTIEIADDQYSATITGGTAGLLKAFASGAGSGAVNGRIVNGALGPASYAASTVTSKKSEAVHIILSGGNVKEYGIEPEPPVDPDRIPVLDAHRRGVLDLFRADRRLHPRSPRDQISHRPAQHRNRVCADRRNPHPGAVPREDH